MNAITIDRAHCGPPHSAHGGVAVGRFATLLDGPAEVRLLGPPPLDTELVARTETDDTVVVSGPNGDLAWVRRLPGSLGVAGFRRAPGHEVDDAAEHFLAGIAETGHPFPTCFGCGPERDDPEALRQFPGPASDGDTLARFRVPGDGHLPDWLTLAGLDCPSGITIAILDDRDDDAPAAMVLGTMQCELAGRAQGGIDYQVRGRLVSIEGRKATTEVAMLDPDGITVAAARAVWIGVDPALFGAVTAVGEQP